MITDKYYSLLKPDGLDRKEMQEYTLDLMCSEGIIIRQKRLWRIGEQDFMFLRRDSINKDYFDELMKHYCNQTHELIRLDMTCLSHFRRAFVLDSIRKRVREQYAASILINGIHIPSQRESLIESVYYDMIMRQK